MVATAAMTPAMPAYAMPTAAMPTAMEAGATSPAPAMPAPAAAPAEASAKAKAAPVPAGPMPAIIIPAVMPAAPDIDLNWLEHRGAVAGVNAGDQLRIGRWRGGAGKKGDTDCGGKDSAHANPLLRVLKHEQTGNTPISALYQFALGRLAGSKP